MIHGSYRRAMSAVLASAMALGFLVLPSPADATTSDCDGYAVVGVFSRVYSFDLNGRTVELQNESALDTYSRAEIKSGYRSGDAVWIDRSHRRFALSEGPGPIDAATAESQGWKQCGPFFAFRTQSVNNSVHAARACARADGVSHCGYWYLD